MRPPNPDDCADIECCICGCPSFVRISSIKAISILQLPPKGGHFEMTKIFCSSCQVELDLERAKKWAFLTPKEREHSRAQYLTSLKEMAEKKGLLKDGKPTGTIITP